jgi:hypothetical protein
MNKFKTEIKWGVIFVLATLLWNLLERLLGFHSDKIDQHAVVTMFFMIPATVIYVLALRDKRNNDLGGKMTYKQGLIAGLIITLVVTILTPLSQYLAVEVISPDYFPNMIEHSVALGEKTLDEAQDYFSLQNYMVQSLIFAPVAGIVTSLIVALFMRKS